MASETSVSPVSDEPIQSRPPDPQTEPSMFEAVSSGGLHILFWVAFFALIISIFVMLIVNGGLGLDRYHAGNTMFISGLVTASLALLAFRMLMRLTPGTFITLWRRGIIAGQAKPASHQGNPTLRRWLGAGVAFCYAVFLNDTPPQTPPDYKGFTEKFAAHLNSRGQWIVGGIFFLLPLIWLGSVISSGLQGWPWFYIAIGILQFGAAFLIGLMAWRMIIIALGIAALGRTFDLTPQLRHPDNCGGLEPLGILCLWNAVVVSIAGIFLGGWSILLRDTTLFPPGQRIWLIDYSVLFPRLLVIPVAFALIGFFVPLLSVRWAMLKKAEEVRIELDKIGHQINALTRDILADANQAELSAAEDYEKKVKKLERLRAIYEQNQRIPTWPFNLRVLLRFASLQIVPALSLLGWGQPLIDILSALLAGSKSS